MTISLRDGKGRDIVLKNIKVDRDEAEKLLSSVLKTLEAGKAHLEKITKVIVADKGGSFTSLRIGVVTANALAYALGVPVAGETGAAKKADGFDIAVPAYGREPNITLKKS